MLFVTVTEQVTWNPAPVGKSGASQTVTAGAVVTASGVTTFGESPAEAKEEPMGTDAPSELSASNTDNGRSTASTNKEIVGMMARGVTLGKCLGGSDLVRSEPEMLLRVRINIGVHG